LLNIPWEVLLSAEKIQARVDQLATDIARDYHDRPVTIVGVLTGCLMFLADLIRRLDLRLRVGLVQASSYRGEATSAGPLRIDPALLPDVRGRHVLLLDDILDTGRTLRALVDHLKRLEVASIRTAGPAAQAGAASRRPHADYGRLRYPQRLRGRLRPGLQRRAPPPTYIGVLPDRRTDA